MYNICIDTDGYWIGGALTSEYAAYENGVYVDSIPDEPDMRKRKAYKLVDGVLTLDAEKLAEIEANIAVETPTPTPEERIAALEAANAELREALELILTGGTE